MKRANLSGEKFGRWTVICYHETRNNHAYWRVRCDCGRWGYASTGNLRHKLTLSCGCLMREHASAANRTHGLTGTKEHSIWNNMKTRCYNSNRHTSERYIGRGITVCDEWRDSFETFLKDMGKCPKGMTIDRINNDLGYSKKNCRWATLTEQARNRRDTRIIELNGEKKPLTAWLEDPRCCVGYWTLRTRLDRGWGTEEAITSPKLNSKHKLVKRN